MRLQNVWMQERKRPALVGDRRFVTKKKNKKKKNKTRQEDASAWGITEGNLGWSTEEMTSHGAPGGLWRPARHVFTKSHPLAMWTWIFCWKVVMVARRKNFNLIKLIMRLLSFTGYWRYLNFFTRLLLAPLIHFERAPGDGSTTALHQQQSKGPWFDDGCRNCIID